MARDDPGPVEDSGLGEEAPTDSRHKPSKEERDNVRPELGHQALPRMKLAALLKLETRNTWCAPREPVLTESRVGRKEGRKEGNHGRSLPGAICRLWIFPVNYQIGR